jgi:biotin operon repressor
MERLVKGIWIPIEIWEAEDLSWNEKFVLMEIDSFTQKGKECYISNRYLADKLGVSEVTISKYISHLIEAGYVKLIKFDGRARYVESALPSLKGRQEENFKADLKKTLRQSGSELKGTYNNRPSINIPNKEKSINTPKEKFNFRNSVINAGASAEVADQWLEVRRNKRLTNTELALADTLKEIRKAGLTVDAALRECVIRSWGGFKAEWLEREQNGGSRGARPEKLSGTAYMIQQMERRQREQQGYDPNDLPDEQ